MAKLFLLRHLKSQWNQDNRFAGFTDGPLAKGQEGTLKELSDKIFQNKIDIAYTSPLFRNMDTVAKIFEWQELKYPFFIHLDPGKMQKWGHFDGKGNYIPVCVSEKLNERYYGELQGLNKEETIEKYGKEQVQLWRRSYNIAPPGGESLKDVFKRAVPFYKKYIEKDLEFGKNVLVVASHNSLRAIVKYAENISDEKISEVELPFGSLAKYDFDGVKYEKLQ
jgi:2,3-bisphosphoglycerate-dependent phosphoglycerate mutase